MSSATLIIFIIAGAIALIIFIKKGRTEFIKRAVIKQKVRKLAIEPSLTFYLKSGGSSDKEDRIICLQNTGRGRALNVTIKDFHHPDEKDWTFKFEKTLTLEPGEETEIDFKFIVGDYKASNKFEQLWMFDPAHDHDFASNIVLSYFDIDGNGYNNTITIGEDKKPKVNRSKLIHTVMPLDRLK